MTAIKFLRPKLIIGLLVASLLLVAVWAFSTSSPRYTGRPEVLRTEIARSDENSEASDSPSPLNLNYEPRF